MYVPVFSLSESQHCASSAACATGPMAALRSCLSNRHFRTFTSSEFAFSFSNTLIMTGMPYYLETLLGVSAADYLMLTIGGFIALAFVVRLMHIHRTYLPSYVLGHGLAIPLITRPVPTLPPPHDKLRPRGV